MDRAAPLGLSPSLEDYLETIYDLVRRHKFARVKEIAKARGVKPGSVSPAMRRLAELDLIRYEQREYIDLTPKGEREARRILARHNVLTRFFTEILLMEEEQAVVDACAMEHSLSDEGMDRLTRLFEFIKTCPEEDRRFLERFHASARPVDRRDEQTLVDLKPGDHAVVSRVVARGPARRRLLDMGILPDTVVQLERVDSSRDTVRIRLQGFQIALERSEAEGVLVAGYTPGNKENTQS